MSNRNRGVWWEIVVLCGGAAWAAAGCQAAGGFAFNNSGKAYYQRGNYAMARDEFQRATMEDPLNPNYRHNLALALKKTGDVQGAEQVLRQNLAQVSSFHQPTYHSLAQLLMEQNRYPEAQDLLQTWAGTQPYVPESQIELAWFQRETGNLPAAEQSLRNALAVDPRHPVALAHLGQLYQDAGQPDRAAAMYQRSLAMRSEQPQVRSRLQMLVDGSSRSTARTAMVMNPAGSTAATFASGPALPYASTSNVTVSSMGYLPNSGVSAEMAAAPTLGPSPDPAASGLAAANPNGSSPVTFETPVIGSVIDNADPAHATTELTAELPLVEPH